MTKKLALLAALAVATAAAASAEKLPHNNVTPDVAHTKFVTSVPAQAVISSSLTKTTPEDTAKAFAAETLKVPESQLKVANVVPLSAGASAVHFRQVINGVEVANAHLNVNIAKDGSIMSYGDSFYRGAVPSAAPIHESEGESLVSSGLMTPDAAYAKFLEQVGAKPAAKVGVKDTTKPNALRSFVLETDSAAKPVPAKFSYVQVGDKLELAYNYETDLGENWFNGHVDAKTGKLLRNVDYGADAKFTKVIPITEVSPDNGGVRDVTSTDAQDKTWFSSTKKTEGNNAVTKGGSAEVQPSGGDDLDFSKYSPDFTKEPSDPSNVDASTVQLHYVTNMIHDLLYQYGFDEASGNFQKDNFGKGGKDNDAVNAFAQSAAGVNNAKFFTPPDGRQPRMRMYRFTKSKPGRDGDYETGVPVHEYGHGLSMRLTGGPARTDCLDNLERSGLGEGWSDALAMVANAKSSWGKDTQYAAGAYVMGNPKGIRNYPYTSDMSVNPSTYKLLTTYTDDEHDVGEVWTSMLWEVFMNLRAKLGHENNLLANPKSGRGNNLFLQIMIDGMKLQPCGVTFISARDAIIQAEKNLTGGKHTCELWKGFAKRGLGVNATDKYVDDFTLPAECGGTGTTTTAPAPRPTTTFAPRPTTTTATGGAPAPTRTPLCTVWMRIMNMC